MRRRGGAPRSESKSNDRRGRSHHDSTAISRPVVFPMGKQRRRNAPTMHHQIFANKIRRYNVETWCILQHCYISGPIRFCSKICYVGGRLIAAPTQTVPPKSPRQLFRCPIHHPPSNRVTPNGVGLLPESQTRHSQRGHPARLVIASGCNPQNRPKGSSSGRLGLLIFRQQGVFFLADDLIDILYIRVHGI